MHDDRFPRAIRRAFERYEMSAAGAAPVASGIPAMGARAPRRLLPRVALPGIAMAIAVAALAVTVVPARPAFASWQAAPAKADGPTVASADSDCTAADPDHLSGLRLLGSERRGDYTMLLYGDGGAYGLCLTGPDIEPSVLAGPGSGAVDAPGTPDGGGHPGFGDEQPPGVRFVAQPGSDAPIAQRVQAWAIGATAEVARVVIERLDAEPVVATLGEGIAFAWWPAGTEAAAIAAYDAEGKLLQRISVGDMVTEH